VKDFVKYHVFAISIALTLSISVIYIMISNDVFYTKNNTQKTIKGRFNDSSKLSANLVENEKSEAQLIGSLREKNGITLFASSELSTSSINIPYIFLPDSLGIRVNAFGHAHQQSFSIFCQLLALKDEIKDSKITIILSPGWFQGEGTNIEAFLEFVRPNFLKQIIKDDSVPLAYKLYIGEYLYKNQELISNSNSSIDYFINLYKHKDNEKLMAFFENRKIEFEEINYQIENSKKIIYKNQKIDWQKKFMTATENFADSTTENSIYVLNSYYNKYLKNESGNFTKSDFTIQETTNNRELNDFHLLVKLLKKMNAKPSFMIQALNPYFYNDLNKFNPILRNIITTLKKEKIPFINFYTDKEGDYKPGTLLDIMHSGEPTWIKYNHFLVNTYVK